ncbi:unnamed protein product [Chrysoparadoxa australica]
MGKDYYEILGLQRNPAPDEDAIKKAYRKLALKWHPDRQPAENKEQAQEKFQEISHAFEILSDPDKRKKYDMFGEAGINPAAEGDAGDGGASFSGFRTAGGGHGFQFHDPNIIFQQFFGSSDPGGIGSMFASSEGTSPPGGMGGGMPPGMSFMFGGNGPMGGMGMGQAQAAKRAKGPTSEHHLSVSLEELYKPSQKRVRITKKEHGRQVSTEKTIDIKPGWKTGTRLTYSGKTLANLAPQVKPTLHWFMTDLSTLAIKLMAGEGDDGGDIVFIIETKPHPRFTRRDNDLIYKAEIPLKQVALGVELVVEMLDGRKVRVREPYLSSSDAITTLPGEGMPLQKEPSKKGNLEIHYNVLFPAADREKIRSM